MKSPRKSLTLEGMFLFLALFISSAQAAPPTDEVVKVLGVVQYVDGRATKFEETGTKSEIAFQTPVYSHDRIETQTGSTLKIAARNGCLFVLRGEGRIEVRNPPWAFRGDSVRLICTNHPRSESFLIGRTMVAMANGELLFFDRTKYLVVNGAVTVSRIPLEVRKLYAVEDGQAPVEIEKSETDLRTLNSAQTPPRESFTWPAIDKVYSGRVIFGPNMQSEWAFFDNNNYNQGKLRETGPRLQFHFKTHDDHSNIIALSQNELQDHSKDNPSGTWPPPQGANDSLEQAMLEFGRRAHFDRWWSPYWRIGLGYVKAKLGYTDVDTTANTATYTRLIYEYYVVTAAYGVDAHVTPKWLRPFGFYASAEAQAVQSIFRGKSRITEGYGSSGFAGEPKTPDEPWRLTAVNVGVNLGVQYDF